MNVIYSDDPEAIKKLTEKIAVLEKERKLMKEINADYRRCKGDVDKMISITDETKQKLKLKMKDAYSWEQQPFPKWQLSNLGANIRTAKKRHEDLEKMKNDQTTEKEINGVKIVENVEDNRCQLFFPGKPCWEIRRALKSHGFKWSRYNGCWQRHRSGTATYHAEQVVNLKEAMV